MTTEVRQKVTVHKGGWVRFRLSQLKAGTTAEVVVRIDDAEQEISQVLSGDVMTSANLLASGLVGIWKNREDIGDSSQFARQLRHTAEHRELEDDPD